MIFSASILKHSHFGNTMENLTGIPCLSVEFALVRENHVAGRLLLVWNGGCSTLSTRSE